MFTNRIVAAVALLFAAVLLAQPGPAIAQSDVDKAMGVPPDDQLPSPGSMGKVVSPGAAQGIVIVNNKPGDNPPPPADQLPSPGNMGKGVSPGAAQGIIIVNNKPGEGVAPSIGPGAAQGMVHPGAKGGFNPQPEPPGLGAHGTPAMKNIKALQ